MNNNIISVDEYEVALGDRGMAVLEALTIIRTVTGTDPDVLDALTIAGFILGEED